MQGLSYPIDPQASELLKDERNSLLIPSTVFMQSPAHWWGAKKEAWGCPPPKVMTYLEQVDVVDLTLEEEVINGLQLCP